MQTKAYLKVFFIITLSNEIQPFHPKSPPSISLLNLLTCNMQAIDDGPGGAGVFS